ncbi:MAG: nucleotidyltransferase domain-containing protein [Magnetococcales bacterium]|nr:nucleotidyltransferase domain-containing protein [Magnetococcales bacterium]
MDRLAHVCARHGVRQLKLFGSVVQGTFDPNHSDLDFLVEFQELTASEHADAFFGLMADLETLFSKSVDLVEERAIRNPYFRQAIAEKQIGLFHID